MAHLMIVTPCYNEEDNVIELYERIKKAFEGLPHTYDHLYIDNASTDRTVEVLRGLARRDKAVKVIVNNRNFGHIRSPIYALQQSNADATMLMVSDLQDPPELIPQFIAEWEKGAKMVIGVKSDSEESALFYAIRKFYYSLVSKIASVKLVKNFTGFGLYDRAVIDHLKKLDDPYPYFRGLIFDLGYQWTKIPYVQPLRRRGITKNNFYSLYDMAMLGITNHSRVPLRLATLSGFLIGGVSFLIGVGYLVAKLIFWERFVIGTAPILVGFFIMASVQLIFIGIIGEYVGAILTQVQKRPLVTERERINF